MEPLLPAFRRELRARAHHLHPVVAIGHQGLTPAVVHEADVALTAHELIKVRVFTDDRAEREALLARLCDALDCAPVQQIGKLLVVWRPRPRETAQAAEPASSGSAGTARRRSVRPADAPAPTAPAGRRAPAGKAPPGVPRAASRRRRRVPH